MKKKKERASQGKSWSRKSLVSSFETDGVLIDVYNALTRDFQRVKNVGTLPRIASILEYRSIKLPPLSDVLDVDSYKCIYQLRNFFARYTASEDSYTQKERLDMQQRKYEKDLSFYNTVQQQKPAFLQPVIGEARKLIREILGRLDMQEIFEASRFGRRASIGVPYRESYLDVKMRATLTRSPWGAGSLWQQYLKGDRVLSSFLDFRQEIEEETLPQEKLWETVLIEQLRLSFVPKKFDKLRGVMPYPTADTVLSLGIGDIMVRALKEHGLDLARLQAKHRRLVKRMSKHRRSVTMDLSGASDCVTRWLVRLLLPYEWWFLLKKFSFRRVKLPNGRVVHTETFAGMGCGFTFPLQSLIFYALLQAVKKLTASTGLISVYGDDCIFPTPMYPYVERVFEALRLKINRDKTFVERYFRESCGEDCYRGSSVRPYQPEGSSVKLYGSNGAAYLYKILNGVLSRWNYRDIPNTVEVLMRKIALHHGSVLIVPPFQPDEAGLKVSDPDIAEYFDWYIPVERPIIHYPKGAKGLPKWLCKTPSWLEPIYHYRAMRLVPDRRYVRWSYPYYWEKIRSSIQKTERVWNPYEDPTDDPQILGYEQSPEKDEGGDLAFKPYVAAKGSKRFIEQAVASQWTMVNPEE